MDEKINEEISGTDKQKNRSSLLIKIIIVVVVLLVIGYLLYRIGKSQKDKSQEVVFNTQPIVVKLADVQPTAVSCATTRVSCNPQDPNSCSTSICSDTQEMKCVDLSSQNPPGGNTFNSGGAVCLPSPPSNFCKKEFGGIYMWNGYSFADNQTWGCTCMWPNYFSGDDCSTVNHDFCTGGTVDVTGLDGKTVPSNNICSCPPDTLKMIRADSFTPFCAPKDAEFGGSEGLAGSLYSSPDWRNVMFRPVNPATAQAVSLSQWGKKIAQELNVNTTNDPDCTTTDDPYLGCKIWRVLEQEEQSIQSKSTNSKLYVIDNGGAYQEGDNICNVACSYQGTCNEMCDCSDLDHPKVVNLPSEYPTVQYTYYSGDNVPSSNCHLNSQ